MPNESLLMVNDSIYLLVHSINILCVGNMNRDLTKNKEFWNLDRILTNIMLFKQKIPGLWKTDRLLMDRFLFQKKYKLLLINETYRHIREYIPSVKNSNIYYIKFSNGAIFVFQVWNVINAPFNVQNRKCAKRHIFAHCNCWKSHSQYIKQEYYIQYKKNPVQKSWFYFKRIST